MDGSPQPQSLSHSDEEIKSRGVLRRTQKIPAEMNKLRISKEHNSYEDVQQYGRPRSKTEGEASLPKEERRIPAFFAKFTKKEKKTPKREETHEVEDKKKTQMGAIAMGVSVAANALSLSSPTNLTTASNAPSHNTPLTASTPIVLKNSNALTLTSSLSPPKLNPANSRHSMLYYSSSSDKEEEQPEELLILQKLTYSGSKGDSEREEAKKAVIKLLNTKRKREKLFQITDATGQSILHIGMLFISNNCSCVVSELCSTHRCALSMQWLLFLYPSHCNQSECVCIVSALKCMECWC
jgi:hypothetical protein